MNFEALIQQEQYSPVKMIEDINQIISDKLREVRV